MLACVDPLEFTIVNYDFHMLLSEHSGGRRPLSILRGLFNVATIQIKQDITAHGHCEMHGHHRPLEVEDPVARTSARSGSSTR